ncbi:hypothetical protein QE152_g15467 [Popillia japonica]|uniref:Uncharacterized protein n=1 Tax=Popillia japonica TaxID=7064 RepID=A0AAW1L7Z5_POPJA
MGEEALPEDNLPTVSDEKPAIEAGVVLAEKFIGIYLTKVSEGQSEECGAVSSQQTAKYIHTYKLASEKPFIVDNVEKFLYKCKDLWYITLRANLCYHLEPKTPTTIA